MAVASFKPLLALCLITVICGNEADHGEFFTPVSGEKVINAKDSQTPFLSEEFFECRQSKSCVVAKNTQVWKKVPAKKDCKFLIILTHLKGVLSKSMSLNQKLQIFEES